MSQSANPVLKFRQAVPADAAGIVAVLQIVANERVHSAIDQVWTVEEERRYVESLSPREVIHVGVHHDQGIVGLQVLDLWSSVLSSMAHVGQVGTFVLPEWRNRGVGRRLWDVTLAFARRTGYRKLVVQVRGSNTAAQGFYRHLGFQNCGRLARQVIVDGVEDDEVLMELFL